MSDYFYKKEIQGYVVNAFTSEAFKGNPAGVIFVEKFPTDDVMKHIVRETRLPEISFIQVDGETYHIRWFAEKKEIELCGHGTIAAAHVLFVHHKVSTPFIRFQSQKYDIQVSRQGSSYQMTMPLRRLVPANNYQELEQALNTPIKTLWRGHSYLAWINNEMELLQLQPNKEKISALDLSGVIVAAPSDDFDYVCRYFAPQVGIDEDAVTGSAHAAIATHLFEATQQTDFRAAQYSARGGVLSLKIHQQHVLLSGEAYTAFDFRMFL